MRSLVAVSVLLACQASMAGEEQLLREIDWREIQESGQPLPGEIEQDQGSGLGEFLVITNPSNSPLNVSLLALTDLKITANDYALTGSVSYEGVEGTGYLEMWSYFPGGRASYSRTGADFGPMGSLRGSSNWRTFQLPVIGDVSIGLPERLEFYLVLPGSGTVRIGPMRLVQYPDGLAATAAPGAWWSDRMGGWIGGLGGTICGCLGGLIGTLGGLGRARRLVISLSVGIVVFGVACLVAGIVALCLSQPYAVFYPLLLGGILCTTVVGGLLPRICQRYREIELRRMESIDVDVVKA